MKNTLPTLHKLVTSALAIALIVQQYGFMHALDELHTVKQLAQSQASAAQGTQEQLNTAKKQLGEQQNEIEELKKQVRQAQAAAMTWHNDSATVTAYSPYDDQNGINSEGPHKITSTGTMPSAGTFAVDPKRIPYGSQVEIVYADGSVEKGVACDTGGAMRDASGVSIDVFRYTFAEAMSFGKREATVRWKVPTI